MSAEHKGFRVALLIKGPDPAGEYFGKEQNQLLYVLALVSAATGTNRYFGKIKYLKNKELKPSFTEEDGETTISYEWIGRLKNLKNLVVSLLHNNEAITPNEFKKLKESKQNPTG